MAYRDRTVLITGSARGLGKTAAFRLGSLGCRVALNYRNSREEAEATVIELRKQGVQAAAYQADVTVRAELERMIDAIDSEWGGIDILINNAGPFIRERRRFADYTPEEIDGMILGNLLSVLHLDRLVLPGMRRRQWGRIIHFGFGHAGEARGWPHRAAYAAAKVGLVSFTRTLAVEEAEHGITVNMVCPGDIRGKNKERTIDDVRELSDEETPRGRPGSGEDIARVIEFLCEDASDFITGNIIDVTGGLDPIRTLPLRDGK